MQIAASSILCENTGTGSKQKMFTLMDDNDKIIIISRQQKNGKKRCICMKIVLTGSFQHLRNKRQL